MSYIIFIICIAAIFNPQHDRELVSPILLSGYACFQRFKGFKRRDIPLYSVLLFGAVITMSYLTTNCSSMNYRPLLFLYLGIGTFLVTYLFVDFDIKILRWVYYAAIVTGVWYIIFYYVNSPKFFNPIFMHKNVGGLFWAMSLIIYKPNKWEWLGYPVIAYALLISGARGAIGALIFVGILYIIVRKKWKLLVPLALLITLTVIFQGKKFKFKDITHGRTTITWPKMWEMVKEKPITGVGIGNMHSNSLPNNVGPHNFYLFLHSCGGIAALLLFFIPFLTALNSKFLNLKLILTIYLLYGIVSECAVNTPPNQIIYWMLVGFLNDKNSTVCNN